MYKFFSKNNWDRKLIFKIIQGIMIIKLAYKSKVNKIKFSKFKKSCVGIEPVTFGLQVQCSIEWAKRAWYIT